MPDKDPVGELMRISDKAIVLQAIPYGDKKQILKLFCRQQGLITAAVIKGNSKSSKVKAAHIRPMSLIECQFTFRENKDVKQLSETQTYYICEKIHLSLPKLSILQFMNEVLLRSVKEQSHPSALYDLIEDCICYLNEKDEASPNLHIHFLLELSRHLGFEPHNNLTDDDKYFDCREGRFIRESLSYPLGLDAESSAILSDALDRDLLREKLTNEHRRSLLDSLNAYFQLHVPGFNQLRSIAVLREVSSV